jgi:hypothetical protein
MRLYYVQEIRQHLRGTRKPLRGGVHALVCTLDDEIIILEEIVKFVCNIKWKCMVNMVL